MIKKENSLLKDKHILICLDDEKDITDTPLDFLKKNFCGLVLTGIMHPDLILPDRIHYLCGDIDKISETITDTKYELIYVIKELSTNYNESSANYHMISIGEVPINVHNAGVYFRKFFNSENYFDLIKHEHQFQALTESNKPSSAFRKGIYLSKVEQINDELTFNLLRCSSNLDGPTDNFRDTDNKIITRLNNIGQLFFEEEVELNHVLAQIYENTDKKKAKISAHSDKTKDMPTNGLIAFCTFYDNTINNKKIRQSKTDPFDYCYQNVSVLTKLHFRLKNTVEDENLVKEFSVTLYPNSVFIIPLSTNRLYTHEIRPSVLSHEHIPVRMGYVVRCSKTKAIFRDGQTYIKYDGGECVSLKEINPDAMTELRTLYYEENVTDHLINYGKINFSMNHGDYLRPNL